MNIERLKDLTRVVDTYTDFDITAPSTCIGGCARRMLGKDNLHNGFYVEDALADWLECSIQTATWIVYWDWHYLLSDYPEDLKDDVITRGYAASFLRALAHHPDFANL